MKKILLMLSGIYVLLISYGVIRALQSFIIPSIQSTIRLIYLGDKVSVLIPFLFFELAFFLIIVLFLIASIIQCRDLIQTKTSAIISTITLAVVQYFMGGVFSLAQGSNNSAEEIIYYFSILSIINVLMFAIALIFKNTRGKKLKLVVRKVKSSR